MSKLRVILLAPSEGSLYPLSIAHLCARERGVELAGIVVLNNYTVANFKREWSRLGISLLRKIWNKYVLNDVNKVYGTARDVLDSFINNLRLECKSLSVLSDKYKIPFLVASDLNSVPSVTFMKNKKPDIVLSTGSSMLRKQLFEVSGRGILNVHMGILPRYRGIGATEWPIVEKTYEKVGLGITLHFVDQGVDTGPIAATKRILIKNGDTFEHIEARYLPEMAKLMMEGVRMARDNTLHTTPQHRSAGHQYFALHPRIKDVARRKLAEISTYLS